MPIYTVTFCAMDRDLESNPLWHSCLLLSRFDESAAKHEVLHYWGFYSLLREPSNVGLDWIQNKLGFQVISFRLSGSHGLMRDEEIRYLDLGKGLHGLTFEVTEEKFAALVAKCQKMISDQNAAIEEIGTKFALEEKKDHKIYRFEHLSDVVFDFEKSLAEEEKRDPRLLPFEFNVRRTETANTCKLQTLKILEDILTPKQIAKIESYNATTPRWTSGMEHMYLHSSGPLSRHIKRSGEVVHFRDGTDENVKLHWTIPPQKIETLSNETYRLFHSIYDGYVDEVKRVVSQLQQLEWLFLNAVFEPREEARHQALLKRLREGYQGFSITIPNTPPPKHTGVMPLLQWMTGVPRDRQEAIIMSRLEHENNFINGIYFAATNDDEHGDDQEEDDAWLQFLATQLNDQQKAKLSDITGHRSLTSSIKNLLMNGR